MKAHAILENCTLWVPPRIQTFYWTVELWESSSIAPACTGNKSPPQLLDLVILAVSCPLEIPTTFGLMKCVELYFRICKYLSVSVLPDYTQDHITAPACKRTWTSSCSLRQDSWQRNQKPSNFLSGSNSFQESTHKWFTAPSESCFCLETNLSKSHETRFIILDMSG